jgi:general secretion pathway protein G
MKKRMILASLLALPTLAFATRVDLTPAAKTKTSMKKIAVALEKYREFCGTFPTVEQGLDLLTQETSCAGRSHAAFLKRPIDNDAWGHPFVYVMDKNNFQLESLGRDGKEGGTGEDTDIILPLK